MKTVVFFLILLAIIKYFMFYKPNYSLIFYVKLFVLYIMTNIKNTTVSYKKQLNIFIIVNILIKFNKGKKSLGVFKVGMHEKIKL